MLSLKNYTVHTFWNSIITYNLILGYVPSFIDVSLSLCKSMGSVGNNSIRYTDITRLTCTLVSNVSCSGILHLTCVWFFNCYILHLRIINQEYNIFLHWFKGLQHYKWWWKCICLCNLLKYILKKKETQLSWRWKDFIAAYTCQAKIWSAQPKQLCG